MEHERDRAWPRPAVLRNNAGYPQSGSRSGCIGSDEPDDLYQTAERQARRTRKSRSQLYAEALAEYLARHAPDAVTEAMNRVVEELAETGPDPFLEAAGRRTFERNEW